MFRETRTPSAPDIEGLRNFSERDDRSPAPVFVGRVDALADVEGAVRRVAAGDAQGGIRLVYGAPGAGKSALLEEFAKRWQSRDGWPSPNLRRVGSCITLFEACSAFTARYGLHARQIPYEPSTLEASAVSLPPRPFQLLPAGTTVAGWESHPLRERVFRGALSFPG